MCASKLYSPNKYQILPLPVGVEVDGLECADDDHERAELRSLPHIFSGDSDLVSAAAAEETSIIHFPSCSLRPSSYSSEMDDE